MARTGITYEAVAKVAEELLKKDVTPTIERVRRELRTGSNSTISKFLNDWKLQRGSLSSSLPPVTKATPDTVNDAIKAVWHQMQLAGQEKIDQIQTIADQTVAEAIAERDEVVAERANLQQQIGQLQARCQHEKEAIASLEHANQSLSAQLTLANEKYQHLKTALETVQTQHDTRVGELKQQIDHLKMTLDNQRHQMQADIDSLTNANHHLQQVISRKEENAMQLNTLLTRLDERVSIVNQEITLMKHDVLAATQKEQGTLAQIMAQVEAKQEPERKQSDALKKLLAEMQESLEDC